jgi:6-phosphofructokinase 1
MTEKDQPMPTAEDLAVKSLGPCRIDSPLRPFLARIAPHDHALRRRGRPRVVPRYGPPRGRQRLHARNASRLRAGRPAAEHLLRSREAAGGIVTCGGLCPGLNDVIRGLVMELSHHYGVQRIYGFRNGYQGFIPRYGHDVLDLTPAGVSAIDEDGGTILGTSRGSQDPHEIVDCLERMNINALFVIGGDGSIRGAMQIAAAVAERGQKIAVVGIPKTIDNDIPYIDQSFGFQTAFGEAAKSIRSAHVEAKASPNGVGLVKLMGRHSGFIACYAALAESDANYVLIPEVPFALDGPGRPARPPARAGEAQAAMR